MGNPPPLNRAIADQLSNVETTLCLSTKVIVITEDRLELRVEDGMHRLSARDSWVAPAGMLITCIATLFTSDFKNFSWVTSGTLKGLFVAATVASFGWLVWVVCRIRKFGRSEFMESIRKAGAQYNYAPVVPAEGVPSTVTGEAAREVLPIVAGSLQCRQCGSVLPRSAPGQMTRCPVCGAVN